MYNLKILKWRFGCIKYGNLENRIFLQHPRIEKKSFHKITRMQNILNKESVIILVIDQLNEQILLL